MLDMFLSCNLNVNKKEFQKYALETNTMNLVFQVGLMLTQT